MCTKKVCFVCLKSQSNLNKFLELVVNTQGKLTPMIDMLSYCCSVKLKTDSLNLICVQCVDACVKAYHFLKQFRENNKALFDNIVESMTVQTDSENVQEEIKIEFVDDDDNVELVVSANSTIENINNFDCDKATENNSLEINNVDDDQFQNMNNENVDDDLFESIEDIPPEAIEEYERADLGRPHYCPICMKSMFWYSSFTNHLKVQHPNDDFNCNLCENANSMSRKEFQSHYYVDHYNFCNICQISFPMHSQFEAHLQSEHETLYKVSKILALKSKRSYKKKQSVQRRQWAPSCHTCPICNVSVRFAPKLKKHMKEEHGNNSSVNCRDCSQSFPNVEMYFQHYERQHFNNCGVCNIGFRKRAKFIEHQALHAERPCYSIPKLHQCPACAFEHKKLALFINHLTENHFDKIKCKICDATLNNGRRYVTHYFSKHRIPCKTCNQKFKSNKEYRDHLNTNKFKFVSRDIKDSQNKEEQKEKKKMSILAVQHRRRTHICPICGEKTRYLNKFFNHVKGHINENDWPLSCLCCNSTCLNLMDFTNHYNSEHYIKCTRCNLYYVDRNSLANHFCQYRTPEEIKESNERHNKRSICPICGKSYRRPNLKYHMETHDSTLKYKCDMCDKMFMMYDQLRYHRYKIHFTKNHLCPYCGRQFIQKYHLTSHLQTHTGVKLFACLKCGQKFTTSSSKKKHMLKNICGKQRPRISSINDENSCD